MRSICFAVTRRSRFTVSRIFQSLSVSVCDSRKTSSGRTAGRRPGPTGDQPPDAATASVESAEGRRSRARRANGVRVSAGDRPLTRHGTPFRAGPDITSHRTASRTQIRTPVRNGVISSMVQGAKWQRSLHWTLSDSNTFRKIQKFFLGKFGKITIRPAPQSLPFQPCTMGVEEGRADRTMSYLAPGISVLLYVVIILIAMMVMSEVEHDRSRRTRQREEPANDEKTETVLK